MGEYHGVKYPFVHIDGKVIFRRKHAGSPDYVLENRNYYPVLGPISDHVELIIGESAPSPRPHPTRVTFANYTDIRDAQRLIRVQMCTPTQGAFNLLLELGLAKYIPCDITIRHAAFPGGSIPFVSAEPSVELESKEYAELYRLYSAYGAQIYAPEKTDWSKHDPDHDFPWFSVNSSKFMLRPDLTVVPFVEHLAQGVRIYTKVDASPRNLQAASLLDTATIHELSKYTLDKVRGLKPKLSDEVHTAMRILGMTTEERSHVTVAIRRPNEVVISTPLPLSGDDVKFLENTVTARYYASIPDEKFQEELLLGRVTPDIALMVGDLAPKKFTGEKYGPYASAVLSMYQHFIKGGDDCVVHSPRCLSAYLGLPIQLTPLADTLPAVVEIINSHNAGRHSDARQGVIKFTESKKPKAKCAHLSSLLVAHLEKKAPYSAKIGMGEDPKILESAEHVVALIFKN